jgi:hypothetical protein
MYAVTEMVAGQATVKQDKGPPALCRADSISQPKGLLLIRPAADHQAAFVISLNKNSRTTTDAAR